MHSNPKMPNFNQTECSQTSLLLESNVLIESHLASLKLHIITTSDSSDSSAKSCCRSKYMDAVSAVTNYQRVTLGTACVLSFPLSTSTTVRLYIFTSGLDVLE